MERQMVIVMGIWAIGLVILGISNAGRVNVVSCTEALTAVNPCMSFLAGPAPNPSMACCSGVAKVKEEANTTEIRRELCACFKEAPRSSGVNPDKAKELAGLCGVQDIVPIHPNIDCSKIPA